MSYVVKAEQQLPIVSSTLYEDFNAREELPKVLEELRDAFAGMKEPFFYISDTTEARWKFADMVQAMASAAVGGGSVLKNRNLQQIIVVTGSSLVEMGVSALSQPQYGLLDARTCATYEDAIEWVRKQCS
ncbi:MAG: hypothetical protein GYB68_08415 [Chloroflexi bacterium]|nr:hypothetical protein [Chloroflexota bacterium]